MATYAEKSESESHGSVKAQTNELVQDVKGEVKHEVSQMHSTGQPVTPSHSDHVVRRHVFGLSVGFFVAIVVFLALIIAGFLLFGHH